MANISISRSEMKCSDRLTPVWPLQALAKGGHAVTTTTGTSTTVAAAAAIATVTTSITAAVSVGVAVGVAVRAAVAAAVIATAGTEIKKSAGCS